MTTEGRLVRIEDRLRRRPAPPAPTTFDPTRLTPREAYELDQLLAPLAPLPHEEGLAALTDEQLERVVELMDKAHGIAPPDPWSYMAHRDPGIGECWCGGVGRCRQQEGPR